MARRKKRRLHRTLHDYFIPHRGNRYKPGVFALGSVSVLVALVLVFLGIYVVDTKVGTKSGFFASVLPAALTAYTNADRLALSLPGLTEDPLLAKAAQMKADDMAAKGYFAHVSPDGKTPWYWLDQMGYKYSYAGENLAVDFVDSKDVEDAWMQSPAHHANIVKPNYTKIGIGVASGMYQGRETTFVVELFAAAPDAESPTVAATPQASTDPRVLGAESAVPAVKHTEVAQPPHEVIAKAEPQTQSVEPETMPASPVEKVATSPTHVFAYILAALLLVILGLLGTMMSIHARIGVRSLEMTGGGLVLASLVAGCLYFAASSSTVILPSDGQAASVSLAL